MELTPSGSARRARAASAAVRAKYGAVAPREYGACRFARNTALSLRASTAPVASREIRRSCCRASANAPRPGDRVELTPSYGVNSTRPRPGRRCARRGAAVRTGARASGRSSGERRRSWSDVAVRSRMSPGRGDALPGRVRGRPPRWPRAHGRARVRAWCTTIGCAELLRRDNADSAVAARTCLTDERPPLRTAERLPDLHSR